MTKLLKKLINRRTIYSTMVALGSLMIVHASYIFAAERCDNKEQIRKVAAFYALMKCSNKKCVDYFYKKIDEERKKDLCRFINHGQRLY